MTPCVFRGLEKLESGGTSLPCGKLLPCGATINIPRYERLKVECHANYGVYPGLVVSLSQSVPLPGFSKYSVSGSRNCPVQAYIVLLSPLYTRLFKYIPVQYMIPQIPEQSCFVLSIPIYSLGLTSQYWYWYWSRTCPYSRLLVLVLNHFQYQDQSWYWS